MGQPAPRLTPQRPNEGRSRLTFAILVLLVFLALSVTNAVIGAAVVGYILAGLFKAAKYNMSTYVLSCLCLETLPTTHNIQMGAFHMGRRHCSPRCDRVSQSLSYYLSPISQPGAQHLAIGY